MSGLRELFEIQIMIQKCTPPHSLTPVYTGVYIPNFKEHTHLKPALANLALPLYVAIMFYTYICTNKLRGILYTGHTDDLSARMEQHKQKVFGGFTAKHGCGKLVWFATFRTREEAFKKERQIKKWKRAYKLNVIELDNPYWLDIHEQTVWPPINGHLPVPPADSLKTFR